MKIGQLKYKQKFCLSKTCPLSLLQLAVEPLITGMLKVLIQQPINFPLSTVT